MSDFEVKIETPQLDGVAARLSTASLFAMVRVIADEIAETVREHLSSYAPSHHRTAALLGARPTGNIENATVAVRPSADGAVVEVGAMGIRRALGPLVITPRNKQSLTIPVNALAYGRTVAELTRRGIEIFRPRGRNYLACKPVGATRSQSSEVLYVLAKRAVLKHEPALLPTEKTLQTNAARAARAFLMGERK